MYFINKDKLFFILIFFFSIHLSAQVDRTDICEDGDCPVALLDIKVEKITKGKQLQASYLNFQQIKDTYSSSVSWKNKYMASQIGGKSCLRHYHLESYFAEKYFSDTEFKEWMDKNAYTIPDYAAFGFANARKGLNLKKRIENNCPSELKDLEKKKQPDLNELPLTYMSLGREAGYFDEKGNLIKPIDIPKEETQELSQAPKMTKKKQVEDLKQRVAVLPVGEKTSSKLAATSKDLKKAKERSFKLGNLLKTLVPAAAAFLAPQLPLTAGIGKAVASLNQLMNWKPKLPRLELLDKLKNLFSKGKALKKKADAIVDQSKILKDKFSTLDKKAEKLVSKIEDKTSSIVELQKRLADLQNQKNKLVQKLEDKPKKILEELQNTVGQIEEDAERLMNKTDKEESEKNDLIADLGELEEEKDLLIQEQNDLAQELEEVEQQNEELQKQLELLTAEVEQAKEEDIVLQEIEENMVSLPEESEMEQALMLCEEDLKSLLSGLAPIKEAQNKINTDVNQFDSKTTNVFQKVKDLLSVQDKVKVPDLKSTAVEETLGKVNGLMKKSKIIGQMAEVLMGKKTKLQGHLETMDQKIKVIEDTYTNREVVLEKLKGDLIHLIDAKTGIQQQLLSATGTVGNIEKAYDDFMKQYNIFDDESKCIEQKELEDKMEELEEEQDEVISELDDVEEDLEDLSENEEVLREETEALVEEIEEEEAIKEEFGKDVDIDPVSSEEWSESFQVKREYWDAVFHPDDEVVEGYKGRWFQVKLKDADKNIKLLFGPGEYYMSKADFRDNYGSVIGAFVTEALNGMKKVDREDVKLFVQGSADITGQNSFKGKLNANYSYEKIDVLPVEESGTNFGRTPTEKNISSTAFTNSDLPNLRGRYLMEMISVYSKKLDPILLEGTVKEKESSEDRNALIYLFIPQEVVNKYGN